MKKPQRVALVGAGNISGSPVAQMAGLALHLGPVKSNSLRVASRLANTLRAGHAVADYAEFATCRAVLIAVPDEGAQAVAAELAACDISWSGKAVVVCSSLLGCAMLADLEAAGASTGSLALVPGFEESWFLLEGNRALQRQVAPLLAGRGMRVTAIEAGSKADYAQAMQVVSARGLPLLREAADGLRSAGISNAEVGAILEKQLTRGLRSYLRSGKPGA